MYSENQHDDGYTLLSKAVEGSLRRGFGRLSGIALLLGVAVCWMSLLTWSVTDPSLTHATSGPVGNVLGYPGAAVSDLMLQTLGVVSAILLLAPMFWGLELTANGSVSSPRWRLLSYAASVLSLAGAMSIVPKLVSWPLNHGFGGVAGDGVEAVAMFAAGHAVGGFAALISFIVLLGCGIFFGIASLGIHVAEMRRGALRIWERSRNRPVRSKGRQRKPKSAVVRNDPQLWPELHQDPGRGSIERTEPKFSQTQLSERHWQEQRLEDSKDFRSFEYARRVGEEAVEPLPDRKGTARNHEAGAERHSQVAGKRGTPDFVPAFDADFDDEDRWGEELDSASERDIANIAIRFAPNGPDGRPVAKSASVERVHEQQSVQKQPVRKSAPSHASISGGVKTDAPAAPQMPPPVSTSQFSYAEMRCSAPKKAGAGRKNQKAKQPDLPEIPVPVPEAREDSEPQIDLLPEQNDVRAEKVETPDVAGKVEGGKSSGPLVSKPRRSAGYYRPSLNLLTSSAPARPGPEMTQAVLRGTARLLEDVLERFGVKGTIAEIRPGPVVTVYDVHLEKGSNPMRVVGLADDIGRSMNAGAARVAVADAPTGAGVIIELPNVHRHQVQLRDLLSSEAYRACGGHLPAALGLATGGDQIVADLGVLGNVLVAGKEKAGKTTLLRSLLLSLIYRSSPDDCRMIVFDPKFLEFGSFNGVPHLLCPVVSEAEKMVAALEWLVGELDERVQRMATLRVQTVSLFNNRVRNAKKRGEMIARTVNTGYCERTGKPVYEHEQIEFEPMPHIVVVIDELSDLMSVAPRQCEAALLRIAEKGRGVGVHLVAATKTTNGLCLTETVRSAMSSSVAFKLGSKVDSRLVIGEQGAEQLLDQGDAILSTPTGGSSHHRRRIHTSVVTRDEANGVAEVLRKGASSRYAPSLMARLQEVFDPYPEAMAASVAKVRKLPKAAE